MPIQTVFCSVVPPHITVQERCCGLVSERNDPLVQPLTISPPGSGCQDNETHGAVYQRSQPSRPAGVSQFATTFCAFAAAGAIAPTSRKNETAKRRPRPMLGLSEAVPAERDACEYVTYPPRVSACTTWDSSYPVAARLWLPGPYQSAAIIRPFHVGRSFCSLLATCLAPPLRRRASAHSHRRRGRIVTPTPVRFVWSGSAAPVPSVAGGSRFTRSR
jgi:hypothetical protein